MQLLVVLIAMCVLVSGTARAHAGEVFEGLSPDLIGTELTTVLEGAELACHQDPADASVRRCQPLPGALDTLGGAKVSALEALFVDDRLAQVSVYFPDRDFPKALAYASKALGEGQDWTVTLRGGMNMGFKDQIVIWERDQLQAIAQQFDRKIDRGSLIYGSPRAMAELMKRIKATPAGGIRDL